MILYQKAAVMNGCVLWTVSSLNRPEYQPF